MTEAANHITSWQEADLDVSQVVGFGADDPAANGAWVQMQVRAAAGDGLHVMEFSTASGGGLSLAQAENAGNYVVRLRREHLRMRAVDPFENYVWRMRLRTAAGRVRIIAEGTWTHRAYVNAGTPR